MNIEIIIPEKTPTINHLHGRRPGGGIYMKPEAREIKKRIEKIVRANEELMGISAELKLNVRVDVYEDWYCKDGSVKRKDVDNRGKFIADSIFDIIPTDDKMIFEHTIKKQDFDKEHPTEQAVVTIRNYHPVVTCKGLNTAASSFDYGETVNGEAREDD